ncbi:MAG: hypothetical protein MI975_24700 [Cytophagales bacterium]|nr:hypothetical protein [Cytophagales bacterium]
MEYDRLFIPAYNSKNKKGDWVSIPRIFRNKLERMELNRYPGEYFLFTKDQRPGLVPVGINYFYRRYAKILESTGLKNSSFKYDIYGFKHSGNINMYLSGVPLDVIQKQNRHQSIDQTIQYLRNLDLFRTSDAFDDVKSF